MAIWTFVCFRWWIFPAPEKTPMHTYSVEKCMVDGRTLLLLFALAGGTAATTVVFCGRGMTFVLATAFAATVADVAIAYYYTNSVERACMQRAASVKGEGGRCWVGAGLFEWCVH